MNPLTGILLPVFSLPSEGGIGSFGAMAYRWIDLLKQAGLNAWQVCPLGPTGFGESPYQALGESVFNPLFIDLEDFVQRGWLTEQESQGFHGNNPHTIDYEQVEGYKTPLLMLAYERFLEKDDTEAFNHFKEEENEDLDVFATFSALKKRFNKAPWWQWPREFHSYRNPEVETYRKVCKKFVDFFKFEQWILTEQWMKIRNYARQSDIELIGDLPLYVGQDSATVWGNRKLFVWDTSLDRPLAVAGVPPDYFSSDGQLWGNPVYDWHYQECREYDWWLKRIRKQLEWFDRVRLDHFRGFYDYWSIPFGEKTARHGQWLQGPQHKLFATLERNFPQMPFILEDLGDLHKKVREFKATLKLPGMAVVQFAFEGGPQNPYLPDNWQKLQVVYTGTHDNDTTCGWFKGLTAKQRQQVATIMNEVLDETNVAKKIIRWILKHRTSQHVIIPLQDILGLGSEARTNTPGTVGQNWRWRCSKQDFHENLFDVIQ